MCTRCQTIKSKEKLFYPGRSHLTYDVPCGHCPSCQQKKEDDWFLRIWKEVKDYNAVGGKVLFVTFTFNDPNLSYFVDDADEIDYLTGEIYNRHFKIPICDKKHMEKFMKAFLKPLEREGFTGKTLSMPIKYFWPGEYGMSLGSTNRPHFHPLLFLPPEVVQYYKTKTAIRKAVEKCWKYGWIIWSKEEDGGMFVDSEFAARYVSKYVFKDDGWSSQPLIKEYLLDLDGNIIKDRYNKIKKFLPTHWQSKHFGESFMEYCENDLVFRDGLDFSFVSDIEKGRRKVYTVPSYIERKCLYEYKEFLVVPNDDNDFDEQPDYFLKKKVLQLNERGKLVKSRLLDFDDKLEKMRKHNADYLSLDYVRKCLGSDFNLQDFNKQYNVYYTSVDDITQQFVSMSHDIDFIQLACYQLSLKGYAFNSQIKRDTVARMCTDSLILEARKIYYDRFLLSPIDAPYFFEYGFVHNKIAENLYSLESYSKFALFDKYIQLAHHIEDYYRIQCKKRYLEDKERKRKFKMSIA